MICRVVVLWVLLVLGAVCCREAFGEAFVVGVAEVKDGDSLVVGGEEMRLLGIDAPEYDQFCGEGEDVWRCGEVAKRRLTVAVAGREVRCSLLFRDAYERWLSRCFVQEGGEDLAALLVGEGLAVALHREYRALMAEVRAGRRGIWGGCFEKPEMWRKGRRKCWHR